MKLTIEIKTAIIAIIILVATIWGFNFLKGKNILKSSNEYYALFNRIDGIVESGNVFIKGYKVGNITKVEYDYHNSGKFVVTLVLTEDIKIPRGTEVQVKTSNLIASAKDLELELSDSEDFLVPGDTLKSGINTGLSELLDPITNKVDNVLLELDSTLNAVNQLLNKETRTHLQNALSSLDSTAFYVKEMMKDGGDLNSTISNMEDISSQLAQKTNKMGAAIDNFEAISDSLKHAEIKSVISNLDSTLAEVYQLTRDINEGNGSVSMLMHDSVLYVNLAQSVASLDTLLTDMKENPKRYVHFSVFGKN